jgi:hypothetical protein
MTDKLNITKAQLLDLLTAAHKAYHAQPKPADAKPSDWIAWYVDYIAERTMETDLPKTGLLSGDPQPPQKPDKEPVAGTILPERSGTKKLEPRASNGDEAEAVKNKTEPDAGALQVCPTCAHRNRPGVLFCENCGTNLITGQQAALGTRDLREAQEIAPDSVQKAMNSGTAKLDEAQEKAVETAGSTAFTSDMMLRIEVEGGATPVVLKPKTEDMILGRRDPTTGDSPEVDLTAFAGYRMGVSRRHASLALENDQLNLWDLGSSNGTFINGNRLTPHQPSPIRDGDEVRLGQMVLRMFFQK